MPRSFLRCAIAVLAASWIATISVGCDSNAYYAGEPPANAVLEVRQARVDTSYDTQNRRTVRVVVESKWEIDRADFGSRPYSYGVVFETGWGWDASDPGWIWTPQPAPRRIANAVDSLRDTLSCTADPCHWPYPRVHVLAELRPGRFLSVASGSVHLSDWSDP
jgi:hypothetical protein